MALRLRAGNAFVCAQGPVLPVIERSRNDICLNHRNRSGHLRCAQGVSSTTFMERFRIVHGPTF